MKKRQNYLPWLRWVAFSLFVTITVFTLLIYTGVFDPKTAGPYSTVHDLNTRVEVDQDPTLIWLDIQIPENEFTLLLRSSWISGEQDMGYGLVVGDDEGYLGFAVSPIGYLSIWPDRSIQYAPPLATEQTSSQNQLVPWQTWPHVRFGSSTNEIWIDGRNSRITTVRINRELLWSGDEEVQGRKIGLWAKSYGDSASVMFEELDVFSARED